MGDDRKATPKVPIEGKRNILITSALPYVNNVPHLGNIIGCVLSADVFARYCRIRGYNAIYMCGTDEYGTATETKALEENCHPKEICDKYHAIHKEVYKWFDISFDEFGRTSTPQQTEICQAIFKKLWENDSLSENTMQQLYCNTCKRFLADRLVEGNCPGCNYDSARGDQCDECGKLLNPTELIEPRCKVCCNTPCIRDTDHLFLELPSLKDQLEAYINDTSGGWSQNAIHITDSWFKDGLNPRCITRDLKWGVPVPHEKYKDKVLFPSALLGTGESWTLLKTISATEYLNYEAGKFSKSKGVGVFGNDVKDTNIPVEVWRYYLLTNRPEVSDSLFSWADLQVKVNSELLSKLGNFVNRVLSFVAKDPDSGYGSIIPDAEGAESHSLTKALGEKVRSCVQQYVEAMEKVKLKQGLKVAMSISSEGNGYLQASQFWKLYKEDRPSCSIVMRTACGLVYLLACLLEPFMPSFSRELNMLPETQFSLSDEGGDIENGKRPWDILPAGHKIGTPAPLFKELVMHFSLFLLHVYSFFHFVCWFVIDADDNIQKDEEVEFYRNKFAGSQADRADRALKAETEAKEMAKQLKKAKISDGKKKKERATKSSETKSKAPASVEGDISISRLDICVGLITKAQKHPDADSLYVEEIDIGEALPRTVVSGLVKYIPLEEMQNRKVCVLCNLKPVSMRGIKSQAMVLATSNSDHTKVELVEPPKDAVIGERVTFLGFDGKPDDILNPKKKVWETVQVDLHTNKELVACYKDVPFTTSVGICKVASISEGTIR
ncbi:hypothetical protein H5410_029081 [Solanum commersonii]|uniref:methionine--tRNA ligase n=1 Tax=Solanum commersonii TaxID=4109 RepID=A0A9J5Z5T5_SOLCO|nr:hypothetical protein H5410_029081 [Solanum commersonii]